MFRHQIDTMATLLDYGYIDSVLLKASVVRDLLEDVPDFNHNLLLSIDYKSPAVYNLVLEVSRRISNMISLGFVTNFEFVARYTDETVRYIYPIAEEVDQAMLRELESLVAMRRVYLETCAS